MLVLNKPSGLLTLPDGYNSDLPRIKSVISPKYGRLWIVHRLDCDTSGVLLFARTESAHRALNSQFSDRQIQKTSHALLCGNPAWQEKRINYSLRPNGDRRHRTLVDHATGKPASTDFLVLERFGNFTLVEACPTTGRTHQIRAHAAAFGYPILADPLFEVIGRAVNDSTQGYAGAKTEQKDASIDRLALHAFRLNFTHPQFSTTMTIKAQYPDDLSSAAKRLQSPV